MSTVIQKCSVKCGFGTASSVITNDGEKPLCEWNCKATTVCPNTFDKFYTVNIHIRLLITTSLDSCGTRSVSCGW